VGSRLEPWALFEYFIDPSPSPHSANHQKFLATITIDFFYLFSINSCTIYRRMPNLLAVLHGPFRAAIGTVKLRGSVDNQQVWRAIHPSQS
jgi:hypothetical protein